ncbi:MAG: hypothetical protein RLZZ401_1177, partial [Pseudomonadota bacterium]
MFALSACGGGGSASTTPDASTPPTSPAPTPTAPVSVGIALSYNGGKPVTADNALSRPVEFTVSPPVPLSAIVLGSSSGAFSGLVVDKGNGRYALSLIPVLQKSGSETVTLTIAGQTTSITATINSVLGLSGPQATYTQPIGSFPVTLTPHPDYDRAYAFAEFAITGLPTSTPSSTAGVQTARAAAPSLVRLTLSGINKKPANLLF